MNYKIAVIPGDGIGPEVTAEAVKILDAAASAFGHNFEYEYLLAGGAAIDETGKCLPDENGGGRQEQRRCAFGSSGRP